VTCPEFARPGSLHGTCHAGSVAFRGRPRPSVAGVVPCAPRLGRVPEGNRPTRIRGGRLIQQGERPRRGRVPGGAAHRGCSGMTAEAHPPPHTAFAFRSGLSFWPNVGIGSYNDEQTQDALDCNQTLYNAVRKYPTTPGSQAIQLWLTKGTSVGILAPGTSVIPW
jgi:hypothetical protein